MAEQPRWPYQGFRRGQREAAEALAETVSRGGVFALSAPTGFGKTAVVVYGLLSAGVERVLYLVRTRNEIAPVMRELRRFNVREAIFLYSARRMCPLLSRDALSVEDFWENCRLLRLRGGCDYYLNLQRLDNGILRSVIERSETPFEAARMLSSLGFCPFFALKTAIGESRFIVATYPYLFRPDIFATTFDPLGYEDLVVVVDEAHSLLHASSLMEARLAASDVDSAIREVEEHALASDLSERLSMLKRLIEEESRAAASGILGGLRRVGLEKVREILGDPQVWEDAAAEVRAAKLREALEEGSGLRVKVALSRVASLAALAHQEGTGAYIFQERQRGLTVLPLEPCSVTREPLNRSRAAVLASGTMPPQRLLRDVLCIEKPLASYDVELLHGPLYPREARIVIIAAEPTSRYTSRSPAMYSAYARYILETYRATRKAVLAVYPSYEFMRSVVSALQGAAGHEPLHQAAEEPGSDIDQVLRALSDRRHLLIHAVAGGKLVEGVEFRIGGENLLGTVFVAGVPYPQPDDYLRDSLAAIAEKAGDPGIERELYEAEAVIRVRQAVGRAQRDPRRDRALIVLADTRYLRRGLRRKLRLGAGYPAFTFAEYASLVRAAAEKLGV